MITFTSVSLQWWIPFVAALVVATAYADDREKPAVAVGAEIPAPPMEESERSAMLKEYSEMVAALTEQIKSAPESIGLYSRRGDCYMFLGEFEKCEADYEKMIALDPQLFAPHWRLGIAYYYTGKFAKSAKQFEAYDGYNNRDRENGIWQYMAQAHVTGLKTARSTMLKYELFDREPFPQLYAMFEGNDATGGDGIIKAINQATEISDNDRQGRLFFAQLYVGIYRELTGDTQAALNLLREAAASKWGQTASGGPTYMWQVARIHFERLVALAVRGELKPLPDAIKGEAD
ncbi:MAG: tetratricopeptide repeat protein [Verrucomicrobiae bacterium]|nr:tetratricopeptide repeat protein [Verrucomicrobiae bacterium]